MRDENFVFPVVKPGRGGPRISSTKKVDPRGAVLGSLYAKAVVLEIAEKSSKKTAALLKEYAKTMYTDPEQKKDLAAMHKRLATGAKNKVVEKYKARPTAGRKSYRQKETRDELKRYSGGVMYKALNSPKLIYSDEYGLGMFDVKFLDERARQWYRMNFGAMPAGRAAAGQGSLKMFQQTSSRKLDISKYKPSGPFLVPNSVNGRGLWSNKTMPVTNLSALYKAAKAEGKKGSSGELGTALYVVPGNFRPSFDKVLSKGIKGSRFLDAGVKYVNDHYGDEMEIAVAKWHKRSLAKAAPKAR